MLVNDPDEVDATHRRIAQIVQDLYGRPDADSDTVIAELAEYAAVEIPGAQYAGVTVTRNKKHIDTPAGDTRRRARRQECGCPATPTTWV